VDGSGTAPVGVGVPELLRLNQSCSLLTMPAMPFWVEPELLAEIEYRAKSTEGKVRHPFFKGLREDL
jgi:ATP-dependent DNA ligase